MKIFNDRPRHIYRYALVSLLCVAGAALGSCMRDDADKVKPDGSDEYLTVSLNLPYLRQPESRAMTQEGENTLDPSLLTVMILKDANDPDSALEQAELVGDIIYEEADRSKATITVKVPWSDTDQIKLCVIANHSIVGSATNYIQFREDQVIDINDKWPTTRSIPMWGETGAFIADDATAAQTVDMYRALARIDVGLNFTAEGGRLTETTTGISNFKLNSIAVYGTKTQIFVAPSAIPPDGSVNAPDDTYSRDNTQPLIYDTLGGVDGYVREIYVPESGISADRNLLQCLVVGGFLDGSATETFYRLEFATYDVGGGSTQLPILRNHRYVFNIKEVVGGGYDTRDDAFDHDGAVSDRVVTYSIDVLDDFIHRVEIEGGNYFGLDNRDIVFEHDASLSAVVRYRTDLPSTVPVTYRWDDPATGAARYAVTIDDGAQTITITTLTDNISGTMYDDVFYVEAGQFSMPIRVGQKSTDLRYSIVCSSVEVNGVYVVGRTLDASQYLTLTLTAGDDSLNGETYVIETIEPEGNHGISFSGTGIFNFDPVTFTMSVELDGTGTLSATAGDAPFKLTINTNSSLGVHCETTIVPVDPTLNILVMCTDSSDTGYDISNTNGGSGKVFNYQTNFGPYNSSIVKISEFNYISASDNIDFGTAAAGGNTNTNGYKWTTGTDNGGKLADMVYIANSGAFSEATAELLAGYLLNGGVIVTFIDDPATAMYLAQQVFNDTSITTQAATGIGGYLFPMPGNAQLFATTELQQAALMELQTDPILKGPFGDITDRQIGGNSGNGVTWSSLPGGLGNALTIYSYLNNLNVEPPVTNDTSHIFGFKLEEQNGRNIFFWGDSGMMTSGADGNPNTTGYTVNPFNWDPDTLFPLPMALYGADANHRMPVDNSAMFTNVMAWAIGRSHVLREKRSDYEDNFTNP